MRINRNVSERAVSSGSAEHNHGDCRNGLTDEMHNSATTTAAESIEGAAISP